MKNKGNFYSQAVISTEGTTAWPLSGILPLRHSCIHAQRMQEVGQRPERLPRNLYNAIRLLPLVEMTDTNLLT